MGCTEFLKARVSAEIKLQAKAIAEREFLSEATWLKRLVLREIRACDGDSEREPRSTDGIGRPSREAQGARGNGKPILVRLRGEDRLLLDARAEARGMRSATYVSVLIRSYLRQLAPFPKDVDTPKVRRGPNHAWMRPPQSNSTLRGSLMPLTEMAIRQAKAAPRATKLFDGRGLFLLVQPSGSRYWRFKYRINGKEKLLALGVYPDVPLKLARERREEARRLVDSGIDPSARRQAEKISRSDTFEAIAREWLALQEHRLSPATYSKAQWTFETLLFPRLGDLPISAIKAPELLAALRKIEAGYVRDGASGQAAVWADFPLCHCDRPR